MLKVVIKPGISAKVEIPETMIPSQYRRGAISQTFIYDESEVFKTNETLLLSLNELVINHIRISILEFEFTIFHYHIVE